PSGDRRHDRDEGPEPRTSRAEQPDAEGVEVPALSGPFDDIAADELDASWVADEDFEENDMPARELQAHIHGEDDTVENGDMTATGETDEAA
ncbi:hypothetical protein PHISP_08714, partial [Aspergillus sp. HF37]